MSSIDDDHSGPAQKRLRTIAIDQFNVPVHNTRVREDRTPEVDWTGHQYKAPKDCKVTDWNHRGREVR